MEILIIFLAKIVEVTLSTLRTVLVTKGEKIYVAIIGFIEVSIWLKVVSVVLTGISESPAKMLAYALGYACGSLVGLTLEEKIGLGYSTIQIIANKDQGNVLAKLLRDEGKAVTILEGEGMDSKKSVLLIHIKRKDKELIMKKIEDLNIQVVVTISETKKIYGGYGIRK